jgi:hypothetical protein
MRLDQEALALETHHGVANRRRTHVDTGLALQLQRADGRAVSHKEFDDTVKYLAVTVGHDPTSEKSDNTKSWDNLAAARGSVKPPGAIETQCH